MEQIADAPQAEELAGELRRAVVSGELTAYFQPVYDLKTRRAVACYLERTGATGRVPNRGQSQP